VQLLPFAEQYYSNRSDRNRITESERAALSIRLEKEDNIAQKRKQGEESECHVHAMEFELPVA